MNEERNFDTEKNTKKTVVEQENNDAATVKVPRLHTLFLGVTEDCNMRCRYCFVHHNPARMTLETAMKALDFLITQQEPDSKRNLNITFFGGEPTLEWDTLIVPVVKRAKELLAANTAHTAPCARKNSPTLPLE